MTTSIDKLNLSKEILDLLSQGKSITVPKSREELFTLTFGNDYCNEFKVTYDINGYYKYHEATILKCKNGAVVNYTDPYMRRRDPECMCISDSKPTDKTRYEDRFGQSFDSVRQETFEWLSEQDLIVMPFIAGDNEYGYEAIMIGPKNAAFFAAALADLQGFVPQDEIREGFTPRAVIYLAPTFRHTHFKGKQVVVHNRAEEMHEVFSFNLYPGPSAKKGIYGVLLNIGEQENWVTVHASTVKVITPYDNTINIMHEGASGGGKSEMIEELHREVDGKVLYAKGTTTDEGIYLEIKDTCQLLPVTDDMAVCPPDLQDGKKLYVKDAEAGWFLRVDHIKEYGTSPHHEKMCIHPKQPLIFFNMSASKDSTCLIWEHVEDEPGKTCPNPRVIMPRHLVPGAVNHAVGIDIRSFGVRTPACTKDAPTYGIIGCIHVLPPALAWLWRLVSPRGFGNPSIIDTEGMKSEGVGSYWPFATGKMVDQANLLLDQIMNTPETKYVLIPNQHIGAYHVGFKAQWIAREYLARRGSARFTENQVVPARCSLLGYALNKMKVDGTQLPKGMLQTNYQLEVGNDAYDEGAEILSNFFKREIKKYLTDDLNPLGRKIIECCLNDAPIQDYIDIMPM